jgi:hypothetical protein
VTFDVEQRRGQPDTVVLDAAADLEIECAIHPRVGLTVKIENKKAW